MFLMRVRCVLHLCFSSRKCCECLSRLLFAYSNYGGRLENDSLFLRTEGLISMYNASFHPRSSLCTITLKALNLLNSAIEPDTCNYVIKRARAERSGCHTSEGPLTCRNSGAHTHCAYGVNDRMYGHAVGFIENAFQLTRAMKFQVVV